MITVPEPRPEVSPEPAISHEVDNVGVEFFEVTTYLHRREPYQRTGIKRDRVFGESFQAVDADAFFRGFPVGPVWMRHPGESVLGGQDRHRLNLIGFLNLESELLDGPLDPAQVRAKIRGQK